MHCENNDRLVVAYIGLGSNLLGPQEQLKTALGYLKRQSGVVVLQVSSCYKTAPVGPQDQPDFMNQVVAIETTLAPLKLLAVLQSIENEMGRVRDQRWGPRVIDLDLLLYGEELISSPVLTVPHPEMLNRSFVMTPLAEIAPDLVLSNGLKAREWKWEA